MANYYGNPAQAKFIDTYVPIPFDALMGLAENAKLERQVNERRLDDIRVKYGNFNSRSQADMNRWNKEVTRPLQDVASRISSNPDAIKGEEGRMLISSVVNNMDYGLLDKLRQNSINLDEAYKGYDPRWQDDTLQQIAGWDTASNGMYNKQNIPYSTLEELATPYYKDLQPSLIPEMSNNKEDYYGITQRDLDRAAQTAYNSLYADPTFQKHMKRMGLDRLPVEQQADFARRMISQSQTDRIQIKERKTRPEYLESVKQSNRLGAIAYRARLAKQAKDEAKTDEFNRVDATKLEILNRFENDKRFTNGQQLTNNYLKSGSITTGDPELNKQIQANTNRFLELSNIQRSGKLTPGELNEMRNLQNTVTNAIPRALGEVGELDYKIAQLKQKGLPEEMSRHLDEARNKILEYTLKMDPNATPGLTSNRRSIGESQYNMYNNYFNESLQRSLDYLTKVNNISDQDKKDLIDRLGGYRTGAIAESNVDDETAAQMGTGLFTERIKTSNLPGDSKSGQSYKATDRVLGVPATKAGVVRLLDYKQGSNDRYISSNDNSLAGKLSNDLFNNPASFNYNIQSNNTQTQFGSAVAPILVKSDGGKTTVHVRSNNGQDVPEFAAKQNVQVPMPSLVNWLANNSQNVPQDILDILNDPQSSDSDYNKAKTKAKEIINKTLKGELGYSPKTTTINGIEYFVLDGGNQMFGAPESNMSYNYNWKGTRQVDYKKANTDASYIDPGVQAYNDMMSATADEGDYE